MTLEGSYHCSFVLLHWRLLMLSWLQNDWRNTSRSLKKLEIHSKLLMQCWCGVFVVETNVKQVFRWSGVDINVHNQNVCQHNYYLTRKKPSESSEVMALCEYISPTYFLLSYSWFTAAWWRYWAVIYVDWCCCNALIVSGIVLQTPACIAAR